MSAVRAVTPSNATTDTATGTGRTTESPTGSAAGDLSRLAKILGNVVAPTTALEGPVPAVPASHSPSGRPCSSSSG